MFQTAAKVPLARRLGLSGELDKGRSKDTQKKTHPK